MKDGKDAAIAVARLGIECQHVEIVQLVERVEAQAKEIGRLKADICAWRNRCFAAEAHKRDHDGDSLECSDYCHFEAQAKRIAELEAALEDERERRAMSTGTLTLEVAKQAKRNAELEAALTFYADPQNWEPVYDKQLGRFVSPIDGGERARKAIS